MTFELGKTYIVDVTKNGIIPREIFDRGRWYDKDYDDLDFLTDEEKVVVINDVLDKIKDEIESQREEVSKKHSEDEGLTNYYFGLNDGLKDARDIIDKYMAESEE